MKLREGELELRKVPIATPHVGMVSAPAVGDLVMLTYVGGEGLARGKIAALLDRGKPRDWYDFYFILRHHELRRYVRSSEVARAREALEKTDINFKSVSVLLPQSHHVILKDFKRNLARELGAYHP